MPDLATRPTSDHPAPELGRDGPTEARLATRRARLTLLPVVLVALAALVWTVAPSLLLRPGPVSLGFGGDAPAAVVEGFAGPQGAYVVGYEHDAYLEVDVRVPRPGPFGAEVLEVQPVLQDAPLVVPVGGWSPAVASATRSADQHEGTWWWRFDNCESYHEREAMVVDRVEVEARVLGRTVVEEVALDRPLVVRSPMLWQCPDRTIERGDDRRSTEGFVRRGAP